MSVHQCDKLRPLSSKPELRVTDAKSVFLCVLLKTSIFQIHGFRLAIISETISLVDSTSSVFKAWGWGAFLLN
jgi:hypothetical protein